MTGLYVPLCAAVLIGMLGGAGEAFGAGMFAVKGLGGIRCADFTRHRAERDEIYADFQHWFDGYVTAFNQFRADTVDILPWQSSEMLSSFVDIECRPRPDDQVLSATVDVLEYLYGSRLRSTASLVEIRVGERTTRLYDVVVRRIQQALTDNNLHTGAITGEYDKVTEHGVRRFQRGRGLPATGFPDELTLLALFK